MNSKKIKPLLYDCTVLASYVTSINYKLKSLYSTARPTHIIVLNLTLVVLTSEGWPKQIFTPSLNSLAVDHENRSPADYFPCFWPVLRVPCIALTMSVA